MWKSQVDVIAYILPDFWLHSSLPSSKEHENMNLFPQNFLTHSVVFRPFCGQFFKANLVQIGQNNEGFNHKPI